MKEILKKLVPKSQTELFKNIYRLLLNFEHRIHNIYQIFITPIKIKRNSNRQHRQLEIGPGNLRIEGFETLNIVGGKHVDYVLDATKKLPFSNESFSIIYTSHIVEHIPWYLVESSIREWHRIIKKDGILEIFVPDGLKICKAFVDAEEKENDDYKLDGWYKFNDEQDPCIWANGRIFSYGDGNGNKLSPNWHMSLFSERYLIALLEKIGFKDIQKLDSSNVRGYDHGWINLGIRAVK